MNSAEAAEVIKATVSTRDTARMLGYDVGRDGFMVCPFHGDTDASLKIYSGRNGHSGWHCFGCGKGGSVIDFVMESEGCGFARAVRILNDGMGLNLLTVENMFTENSRRKEQRKLDDVRKAFDDYADAVDEAAERMLRFETQRLMRAEGTPAEERTAEEWDLIRMLPQEMQYTEFILEKTDGMRKEVGAWRNRARSGRSP